MVRKRRQACIRKKTLCNTNMNGQDAHMSITLTVTRAVNISCRLGKIDCMMGIGTCDP